MRLSIDSLLSDIEEYIVENSDLHPHRYKRLDPRGLLGRAYAVIAELDEKIVEYEEYDSEEVEIEEEEFDEDEDFEEDEVEE